MAPTDCDVIADVDQCLCLVLAVVCDQPVRRDIYALWSGARHKGTSSV